MTIADTCVIVNHVTILHNTCVSFAFGRMNRGRRFLAGCKTERRTMKAFLEEYGIAIFVIACIMILVAMSEPVGKAIQSAVLKTITDFTRTALT